MSASTAIEAIGATRILPVVSISDAALTVDVVAALAAGGLSCVEIALRSPSALAALAASAELGGVVGAGTVLDATQVDASVDAGARFIVSPGFDARVVERALERGVPVIPGVATATEVQRALAHGARELKLFPARDLGGAGVVAALAPPFPQARFVPSGGIVRSDLPAYLGHPSVLAVAGGWMMPRDALARGDLDSIRASAVDALSVAGVSS